MEVNRLNCTYWQPAVLLQIAGSKKWLFPDPSEQPGCPPAWPARQSERQKGWSPKLSNPRKSKWLHTRKYISYGFISIDFNSAFGSPNWLLAALSAFTNTSLHVCLSLIVLFICWWPQLDGDAPFPSRHLHSPVFSLIDRCSEQTRVATEKKGSGTSFSEREFKAAQLKPSCSLWSDACDVKDVTPTHSSANMNVHKTQTPGKHTPAAFHVATQKEKSRNITWIHLQVVKSLFCYTRDLKRERLRI